MSKRAEERSAPREPWASCTACRAAAYVAVGNCWYPACAVDAEVGGTAECCETTTCDQHPGDPR